MNTLLIGPRGCGKTVIGRRLAAARGLGFVDLDDRVLARFLESSVREIWAAHGEPAWRAAEIELLREALGRDDQVLALGGGTPIIDHARRLIQIEQQAGRASVIYLKCNVRELARRLRHAPGDRPSLTGADPAEEIADVLAQREPEYESLADVIFEVGDRDEQAVTSGLIEVMGERER